MASLEEQFFDDFDSSENESVKDEVLTIPSESAQGKTISSKPSESKFDAELSDVISRINSNKPVSIHSVSEHAFVSRAVGIVAELDAEVVSVDRRLREVYGARFPELETILLDSVEYACVVATAGNAKDFATVNLASVLPAGVVITVQVTAATTKGRLLDSNEAAEAEHFSNRVLNLSEKRVTLLQYVEARAALMAPNLTAVVGGSVAAALLGLAGGVKALAYMPSCNLKVAGKAKRILAGASTQTARPHEGVVFMCPLVTSLPPHLRPRAGQAVAGKATLAARVDASGSSRDGAHGRRLHTALAEKFEKWQAPDPAKTAQPLPIPGGEERRRHRGGRRARKEKERMGMTDMRKLANRVKFGEAEATYGNDIENEGFGMLGQEGSHKLRVQAKKTDTLNLAATKKIAKTRRHERRNRASAASGFATSLAFGTATGIELGAVTPAPGGVGLGAKSGDGTKSQYFDATTPFVGAQNRAKRNLEKKIEKKSDQSSL